MNTEELKEVKEKDKWHGSPNSSCPACVNAFKDISHVGCTAIKLYVLRSDNGKRFLNNPEYHCKCFRDKPELHYRIAEQLKPEDVKAVMVLKPKREEFKIVKVDPDETKDEFADQQETLG
jgi:hypothetical protein